ncbi:MAG: HD domain-containing protein [Treponema sp.]|nr:HD domain-containing protein [Treponema sp.]
MSIIDSADAANVPGDTGTSGASIHSIAGAYDSGDQERIIAAAALAKESCPANLDHHLGTARILAGLHLDPDTIIAVLLRDCTESQAKIAALTTNSSLVREAAKFAAVNAVNKTEAEAETIRKMLFAMARDIRVILIKLADKLNTMRNLDSPQKTDESTTERKHIARECLDIYAPLAGRLGISWIKDELEDLALKHLNHRAYMQIKNIVSLKRGERSRFLEEAKIKLDGESQKAGINAVFQSRAKHFYSIYQKMRRRNKAAGDLYDLFGLRLLCDTVEACYTLLGVVHRLWKPIDGRFKDYIAMPKSNGYRSLHTTVFAGSPVEADQAETSAGIRSPGCILEIQIRTREMHNTAEYGIAGHWFYKADSGKSGFTRGAAGAGSGEISLVNRLREWNKSIDESQIFLDDIKRELLGDSIYVFTPQGKVIELPSGATALDFAYQIHSAVGDHCSLARADGAVHPLGSPLKNTQVVEIVTSTASHPTPNWLSAVKTAKARNRIRAWLLQNDETFAKDMRKKTKSARHDETKPAETKPAAEQKEDETQKDEPGRLIQTGVFKVRVEDEKNMLVRFAKCCHPAPGDSIAGYVSRGRGLIIHRTGCRNITHIPGITERTIEAQWEDSLPVKRFRIEAKSRGNLFSEIEGVVRKFQGRLIDGRLEESGTNRLSGYFTMQLEKQEDAGKVLKHLRGIPSISTIQSLT